MPPQFLGAFRIVVHPLADALHRHIFARHDAALDQDAADRRVGIAVMGVVVQAQRRCRPRSATRAEPWICMNSRSVSLFSQASLETALGQRAVLDLAAVVERHELAAADLCETPRPDWAGSHSPDGSRARTDSTGGDKTGTGYASLCVREPSTIGS